MTGMGAAVDFSAGHGTEGSAAAVPADAAAGLRTSDTGAPYMMQT